MRLPVRAMLLIGVMCLTSATHVLGVPADVPDLARRDAWMAERAQCERREDYVGVAEMNGRLAGDAILRARAVHDAWMTRRNPTTGLFPQSPEKSEFNYHNVAADFFCFQFAIAEFTQSPSLVSIKETLARERALNLQSKDGLVGRFDVVTGTETKVSDWDRLFGACEYLKDGLLGLYERTGDADVRSRMEELVDAIERASVVESKFGRIPSRNTEINGNVLQTFSRLTTTLTGERGERCAAMVGRLADAMVHQMLPATGGVPVIVFDYPGTDRAHDPRSTWVNLRDHGNEAAVGLSEAFAVAVERGAKDKDWAARADSWAEPLARMYEVILREGVNKDGLLVSRMLTGSFAHSDRRVCDTWGYIAVGAVTFAEAARKHGVLQRERLESILERVDRLATAVVGTDGIKWQIVRGTEQHDGLADAIESAIYIAHARPRLRDAMLAWCDRHFGMMSAMQTPDGFVAGDYLDGNFIRTAMLYAAARSGGARLDPWSADASVGWAPGQRPDDPGVMVMLTGNKAYTGEVVFDTPRHRERLGLAWNWARLNCWPEWCIPTGEKRRRVQAEARSRVVLDPAGAKR